MMQPAAPFLAGRTLVIFGAGYIGAAVAEVALAGGARVVALTRNPGRTETLSRLGATVVTADLAHGETWFDRMPRNPDFVLNTVSSGGGGLAGYQRSYVEGFHAIQDWWRSRGGKGALVYTSSTAVYPQDGGVAVDESSPISARDERAAVLLEAERLAQSWPGGATVLRLAGIYGPDRHHLLDALRRGEPAIPGRGEHRLNLIHRDDVVSAIVAAFAQPERAAGQVFNVADDAATPKAEVVRWLAQRLGLAVPAFTGEPTSGRRAIVPDRVILNDKLKDRLGWNPRFPTYRDGYRQILAHT